jgi:hypothetical protein
MPFIFVLPPMMTLGSSRWPKKAQLQKFGVGMGGRAFDAKMVDFLQQFAWAGEADGIATTS